MVLTFRPPPTTNINASAYPGKKWEHSEYRPAERAGRQTMIRGVQALLKARIVERLNDLGLRARPADGVGTPPRGRSLWVVEGEIVRVDQVQYWKGVLSGFGTMSADLVIKSSVSIREGQRLQLVQHFEVNGLSTNNPEEAMSAITESKGTAVADAARKLSAPMAEATVRAADQTVERMKSALQEHGWLNP